MTPFKAFVLTCPNGHSEVTLQFYPGPDSHCLHPTDPDPTDPDLDVLCYGNLSISREIVVVPGRRHSTMGCHSFIEKTA